MTFAQKKAIGDWHRRRARRLRVLAHAVRIKLENPYAAAHPDYVRYCNELGKIRDAAYRHMQIAGNFA